MRTSPDQTCSVVVVVVVVVIVIEIEIVVGVSILQGQNQRKLRMQMKGITLITPITPTPIRVKTIEIGHSPRFSNTPHHFYASGMNRVTTLVQVKHAKIEIEIEIEIEIVMLVTVTFQLLILTVLNRCTSVVIGIVCCMFYVVVDMAVDFSTIQLFRIPYLVVH